MPERPMPARGPISGRRLRRERRLALAVPIALVLLLAGLATALAPVALAVPGPGHECEGEAVPSGQDDPCTEGGVGGFDLGFVLPLAGVVAIAGLGILVGGYLVLRRRASGPLNPEPIDAQEWWTCRNCGRNNVVGSARCYACGTWQR